MAYIKESCKGGFGAVARDWNGYALGVFAGPMTHIYDSFAAEAYAAWQALTWAAETGFTNIHLEGDSLSIISRLRGAGEDLSVIGPYLLAARQVTATFQQRQQPSC